MMYKHRPTTPDWLYQLPNLNADLLPQIQQELLQMFEQFKQSATDAGVTIVQYLPLSVEYMQTCCPLLLQELVRLDLQKNIIGVSFVILIDGQRIGMHVDEHDDIALNIPLLNCSDSYTVWYDCNLDNNIKYINRHPLMTLLDFTEIGRVEANEPLWINVNVIHNPVQTHKNFRVAASLRFNPEPLDKNGNLWPHLVRN